MKVLLSALGLLGLAAACQSAASITASPDAPARIVPVGSSPQSLHANWKERLDQPFVFLEHRGDYRNLGDTMRRLLATAEEEGIAVTGPPFALFYDDPGQVPIRDLHARACLPVSGPPRGRSVLGYEVLPQAMVAYGLVPGAYDRVPEAYPVLFDYLGDHGWEQRGPLREIYLVNPAEVATFDELVTEVQIPWVAAR